MQKTIYDPVYPRLIEQLYAQRMRCGLRQREVALHLNIARTWVSKVEECDLRLDVMQLMRLARVYGVPAWPMLKEAEEAVSREDADPLSAASR